MKPRPAPLSTSVERPPLARAVRLGLAAVVGAVVVVPFGPAAPAVAEPCAEAGTAISAMPWTQQRQPPQAIWPVADGTGTRVAVLASGVDATHPQLTNRVRDGQDYVSADSTAPNADCEGLGTQVAGIVAAAPADGIGFTGLAPKATIVPYRVAATSPTDDPGALADAVKDAAEARPDVIVIPVLTYVDDPELKSAVTTAIADDVVVIAAAGEGGPADAPKVPYPAAYDGVIGVGAIAPDGALSGDADAQKVTDLVGPGDQLVSTQVGGGLVPVAGSAIAAGYVAGTVALIRSRWPDLKAPDVIRRLLATATPVNDGTRLAAPTQAVTATMTNESPRPLLEGATTPTKAEPENSGRIALIAAGALAAAALLAAAFAVAVPRGRQRRWRPGLAPRPEEHPEDDEPEPPRLLFEDWTPGPR